MAEGGKAATAHLSNDGDDLVLDVDRPALFGRSLGTAGPSRELPPWLPDELMADRSLRIRSRGRELAVVRVVDGRLRVRPRASGVAVGASILTRSHPRATLGLAGALSAIGLALLRRRAVRTDP